MGGGKSTVRLTSEQVCGGSNGTNYGERAKSLDASGVDVRLVGLGSWLVEGGDASVRDKAPKWHYPCWQGLNGCQWTILVGGEGLTHRVLEQG